MTLHLLTDRRPEVEARPYQVTARERVAESWARGEAPLLVMATGTGKTVTGLLIARDVPGRIVWLAHREELLNQPLAALWYDREQAGVVQAGRNASDQRIMFASFATLDQPDRMAELLSHGPISLIVVDEAHHSVSPSHERVIDALIGPGTKLLGLTATADREDDRDLGERWSVAYSLGIVEAIDLGWLIPPFAWTSRCPGLDLSQVSGRRDYDDAALGQALLAAHIVDHTVAVLRSPVVATRLPRRDEVRTLEARGRAVLVFTATVEQAKLTSEALRAEGWRAWYVSGETPREDRRRLLRRFTDGDIDVLCSAAVLTEGTDLPRCSAIVLARPTKSWSLYCQMVGRGLRTYPGQTECLVVDLAGATEDHSLVAAPALVGGSRCRAAPDGVHAWVRADEGKARCSIEGCTARLPCWESLQIGRDGLHHWSGDDTPVRKCTCCGRPQCLGAPDGRHSWVPAAGWKQSCLYCEAEIPMPLASLQGDRVRVGEPAPAAWLPLRQVVGAGPIATGAIEVLDLGEHGYLFLIGTTATTPAWPGPRDDRPAGTVYPVWLPARARIGRPLTDGPVDRWYAEALAADLVRKSAKRFDAFRGEQLFGGLSRSSDVVEIRRHAAARIVACNLGRFL